MYRDDFRSRVYKYYGALLNLPQEVDETYMKCRRMLHGCLNMKQLSVAKKYIELWQKQLPTEHQFLYERVLRLYQKREQYFLSLRKTDAR